MIFVVFLHHGIKLNLDKTSFQICDQQIYLQMETLINEYNSFFKLY